MLLFSFAATLSFLAVGSVRWYAVRRGILDLPNARSSHVRPTPRGGGLGLVLSLGSAIAWIVLESNWVSIRGTAAALAVTAVGVVGWIDDHGGVSVRWRLTVQTAAGLLILPLAQGVPLPVPLGIAFGWWVFWATSSINVVNFIDGIDGLVGLQSLVFGLFVVASAESGGLASALGRALAGASVGFLMWNWQPAKIFLGDVGSGSLGLVFVILGILLLREGDVGLISAFAPLTPIFLDAAVTMAMRAKAGEPLFEAHRRHLYQRLANGGWGHARVTVLYGAGSTFAAATAWAFPRGGFPMLAVLLTVLGGTGFLLHRQLVAAAIRRL